MGNTSSRKQTLMLQNVQIYDMHFFKVSIEISSLVGAMAVSYTHLDVYKRQGIPILYTNTDMLDSTN